jgi:hypothetical protein
MQKYFLLSLILLILIPRAHSLSNPYKMNHENFVHLTKDEKHLLIIQTMEMMIEMESKYEKQINTSNAYQIDVIKYVQLINKFRQFLLSEAVAADFGNMGKDFVSLMQRKKGKACIYAGWASETKKINGSSYCVHPSMSTDPKIRSAYLSANGKCVGPNKITCNPMIFGYKQAKNEKPFCVETGFVNKTNKSHNASYECMRVALQIENVPKDQDSKEVRLNAMAEQMKANPSAVNSVQDYVFQLCACSKSGMDKEYIDYIRPHRTCFGMMNSMRALGNEKCTDLASSFPKENDEFIQKWNQFFNDENIRKLSTPPNKLPQEFDKEYKTLIQSSGVQNYCSPVVETPPVKEWFCQSKCNETEKGSKKYKCEVVNAGWKLNDKEEPVPLSSFKVKTLEEAKPEMSTMTVELANGTKQLCPITIEVIEEVKKEFVCESKCEKDPQVSGTYICNVSKAFLKSETDSEDIDISKMKLSQMKNVTKEITSMPVKLADDSEQSCPILIEDEEVIEEEPPKSCTLQLSQVDGDKTKSMITASFSGVKEEEITEVNWSEGVTATPNKKNEAVVSLGKEAKKVSLKFFIQSVEVPKPSFSCEIEIPAIVEEVAGAKSYSINAKAEAAGAATVKVNATFKIDNVETKELPSGYKISWSRQGSGASKLKVTKKEEVKTTAVGDGKDGEKTEAKEEVKVTEGEVATGATITEARAEEAYKTCASLFDDKGTSVAGPSCADIPALQKVNPNINNQNYQQRQMPNFQIRPSNTSLQGIL